MDGATYESAKQHLLSVYNLIAPSGDEQQRLVTMVRDMERDKNESNVLLAALASKIYDGLVYGNW